MVAQSRQESRREQRPQSERLTEEQRARLKEIRTQYEPRMQAIRAENEAGRAARQALAGEIRGRVNQVLTPAQQEDMKRRQARRQANRGDRQGWSRDRRGGLREGGRPPMGPPRREDNQGPTGRPRGLERQRPPTGPIRGQGNEGLGRPTPTRPSEATRPSPPPA